jgi:hypothetical protein
MVSQYFISPEIFLEGECGAISNGAASYASEDSIQSLHILPPKGSHLSSGMWHLSIIVFVPYKTHPRDILPIIELVEVFKEEGVVLHI